MSTETSATYADTSQTPRITRATIARYAPLGAFGVLLGSVVGAVGTTWDVEWHDDVGPDTFFTLPHLFLYSGSAIGGITSLIMVLMITAAQRAGEDVPRWVGGVPIRVFGGRFTAPLGFLLCGGGAASFLLYGLLDLWWHTVYGFDAVLASPPHFALFASATVTDLGSIVTFAAARRFRWGAVGLMAQASLVAAMTAIPFTALWLFKFDFNPISLGSAFIVPLVLLLVAGVLRSTLAPLAVAAIMGAIQAIFWWFSPWAAHEYAAAVGLPLRDDLWDGPPVIPGMMPMFLGIFALLATGLLYFARDRKWQRWPMTAIGAFLGSVAGMGYLLQGAILYRQGTETMSRYVTVGLVGLVLGTLAGFLAQRIALMLRLPGNDTETVESTA
ncbi:MFS family permease [Mycobacteroides chelonae]|nr:MFS family permease [Mycobacteroides chelonae]